MANRKYSPSPDTQAYAPQTPETTYGKALRLMATRLDSQLHDVEQIIDREGDSEEEEPRSALHYAQQLSRYLRDAADRHDKRVASQDELLQRVQGGQDK